MAELKTSGSFVARIWLEEGSDNGPSWRGHIQHVQGEEERYFQNFSEMREFLEQVSGVPVPSDSEGCVNKSGEDQS